MVVRSIDVEDVLPSREASRAVVTLDKVKVAIYAFDTPTQTKADSSNIDCKLRSKQFSIVVGYASMGASMDLADAAPRLENCPALDGC